MLQVNWECKTFLSLEQIVGFTEDVSQKELINFKKISKSHTYPTS